MSNRAPAPRPGTRPPSAPRASARWSEPASARDRRCTAPPVPTTAPRRASPWRGAGAGRRRCRAPPPPACRWPRPARRACWSRWCRGNSPSRSAPACPSSPSRTAGRSPARAPAKRLCRERVERQARRQHQALLRARDRDVDAPFIHAEISRGQARDRVHHQQGRVARIVDRLAHIGDAGWCSPSRSRCAPHRPRGSRDRYPPARSWIASGFAPARQSLSITSGIQPDPGGQLVPQRTRNARSRTSAPGRRASRC